MGVARVVLEGVDLVGKTGVRSCLLEVVGDDLLGMGVVLVRSRSCACGEDAVFVKNRWSFHGRMSCLIRFVELCL